MNKFKFSFKVKELELQVEGTREDAQTISTSIGKQFANLLTNMVDEFSLVFFLPSSLLSGRPSLESMRPLRPCGKCVGLGSLISQTAGRFQNDLSTHCQRRKYCRHVYQASGRACLQGSVATPCGQSCSKGTPI